MTKSEIIHYIILRSVGNFLLLFAIFGVFATFGPSLYYELQYQIIKMRGIHYTVADIRLTPPRSPFGHLGGEQETKDADRLQGGSPLEEIIKKQEVQKLANSGFSSVLTGPKEQILTPIDTQFSILIPKLGANARVFPNIDPSNENEFLPVLQQGFAHAKGTVFPGLLGNIYLFAHSADNFWDAGRYNAVFYLLKDLVKGDDIVVFFENRRHNYTVVESRIVDPSDVSYLIKSQEKREEKLLLQTCWPPGTTWKRLIVIARPK